jgi:alpha-D-ribose 1-methylphosphonate 5-triphosphate synthase subunit PhnH
MSSVPELTAIGAGFASPALDSQRVFRGTLEALAHPGRIVRVESNATPPSGLHHSAAAIALALLDQDTRLWLSPSFSGTAGAYLRFHTGCAVVGDCAQADFALADAREMPPLEAFASGSEEYPDRSASVIVQVEDLSAVGGWRLSGPGIEQTARLAVRGLAPEFVAQWGRQRRAFPRGIDVYLACGSLLCGLPRTVRIEA